MYIYIYISAINPLKPTFSHGFLWGTTWGEEFERLLEDSVEMETQQLAPSSPELATGTAAAPAAVRCAGDVMALGDFQGI